MSLVVVAKVVVRLLLLAWYGWDEVRWARWLPWWRRGAPLLPMVVWSFQLRARDDWRDWALTTAAIVLHWWNFYSSSNNKHNKRDFKKLEAESRLTQVQQTAFRREAAEATA